MIKHRPRDRLLHPLALKIVAPTCLFSILVFSSEGLFRYPTRGIETSVQYAEYVELIPFLL